MLGGEGVFKGSVQRKKRGLKCAYVFKSLMWPPIVALGVKLFWFFKSCVILYLKFICFRSEPLPSLYPTS
jgi:hypothetical protein